MRCFVTGTDTDVGKTVVTACLAEAARQRGTVIAAKPLASGVAPGSLGDDAILLGQAAGHPPRILATYQPPVSPHRAILDGGQALDRDALESWVRNQRADTVLVEGVGGWRVPLQIHPRIDVVDLARWTDGPVVVVVRNRLGALNHTALTLEAIRRDGLDVLGVVLNTLPGDDPPPANQADLELLLDVPLVAVGPIDPDDASDRARIGLRLWSGLVGMGWGP